MAFTHTWSVKSIQTVNNGAVETVEYELTSSDGNHSRTLDGFVELTPVDEGNFTSYSDLTEEQVLGWVFAFLGDKKTSFETYHEEKINLITGPTKQNAISTDLPW